MRINGHAHIFTLQSVLSEEAIRIMAGRLRKVGFRDFVVEAVVALLTEKLLRPGYLSEEELLERYVGALVRSPSLQALAPSLPFAISIGGDASGLGVRAVRSVLDRLSSWVDANDGPGKSPFDVFETLRIAMQPSIAHVAESMLKHLGPDDAIVALMMDIVAEDEVERDRLNFRGQIEGTQRAALMYPGRVFPFIAVNPRRPDHLELMIDALESGGFAGVKLYPSLGFEVGSVRHVLEECENRGTPVTVHTTSTGFAKDETSAQLSHPRHWAALLEDMPSLRVCFAHCGGWGGFCRQVHHQIEWAEQIFAYMAEFPFVYADLSYHVDMMISGGAKEQAYLDELGAVLAGPNAERIIFGTDSWLLRLNIDDALYWRWFETHLTPEQRDLVMTRAPARFLGLPLDGMPMMPNIARHVAFLESHADKVGTQPASWLTNASTVTWQPTSAQPGWSRTNAACIITYNHFRSQIPKARRGRGFDDCAQVRLFEADYFRLGGSPPPDTIVSGNVRNMMSVCAKNHGVPRPPYELDAVRDRLVEILARGRFTFAELAASVDSMYRFPES